MYMYIIGIPLLSCGFILVLWVLPAAFVSLSTTELEELGAWRRLKIFSAGVWHNLVLAAIAYVSLVYIVPLLFAPLFQVLSTSLQFNYRCSLEKSLSPISIKELIHFNLFRMAQELL